jgi:hypothetical protein
MASMFLFYTFLKILPVQMLHAFPESAKCTTFQGFNINGSSVTPFLIVCAVVKCRLLKVMELLYYLMTKLTRLLNIGLLMCIKMVGNACVRTNTHVFGAWNSHEPFFSLCEKECWNTKYILRSHWCLMQE